MPFQRGNPGKPKGAVNKNSEELRKFLGDFLNKNRKTIQTDFDCLKPVDRLRFITDIMPFILPKLRQTELSGDMNMEITFKDAE